MNERLRIIDTEKKEPRIAELYDFAWQILEEHGIKGAQSNRSTRAVQIYIPHMPFTPHVVRMRDYFEVDQDIAIRHEGILIEGKKKIYNERGQRHSEESASSLFVIDSRSLYGTPRFLQQTAAEQKEEMMSVLEQLRKNLIR